MFDSKYKTEIWHCYKCADRVIYIYIIYIYIYYILYIIYTLFITNIYLLFRSFVTLTTLLKRREIFVILINFACFFYSYIYEVTHLKLAFVIYIYIYILHIIFYIYYTLYVIYNKTYKNFKNISEIQKRLMIQKKIVIGLSTMTTFAGTSPIL